MPETPALFDLTGKLALVTGCRRGIGQAMAVALARAGADILGVSAHLETSGSEIESQITALGRDFTGTRVDLADRAALAEFTGQVLAHGRPIDILVNNAGTIRRSPAARHSDDDWEHVLTVNLDSQFRLARDIGATMVERGHGKIIFTASLLSFQGGINVIGYTAAKSGIAGITRAFANEWASHGVNVNAIAPGYIATDNTQALRDDANRNRSIVERIPARRWGHPDDLAGATVFLASPAADYVHGVILPVDGGWMGR